MFRYCRPVRLLLSIDFPLLNPFKDKRADIYKVYNFYNTFIGICKQNLESWNACGIYQLEEMELMIKRVTKWGYLSQTWITQLFQLGLLISI